MVPKESFVYLLVPDISVEMLHSLLSSYWASGFIFNVCFHGILSSKALCVLIIVPSPFGGGPVYIQLDSNHTSCFRADLSSPFRLFFNIELFRMNILSCSPDVLTSANLWFSLLASLLVVFGRWKKISSEYLNTFHISFWMSFAARACIG